MCLFGALYYSIFIQRENPQNPIQAPTLEPRGLGIDQSSTRAFRGFRLCGVPGFWVKGCTSLGLDRFVGRSSLATRMLYVYLPVCNRLLASIWRRRWSMGTCRWSALEAYKPSHMQCSLRLGASPAVAASHVHSRLQVQEAHRHTLYISQMSLEVSF